MTPRSGPGGAGSDPRGPKTTPRAPQERPKSRPEAVSEQPWWPPGADLAPKRLPEPSGEPFWPPRGWILAPPRLPVQPSSSHRDKPSSFPKPVWGRRHEAAAYEISKQNKNTCISSVTSA